jgi:ribosomal protein S18 acetylase RimI-like enzyme
LTGHGAIGFIPDMNTLPEFELNVAGPGDRADLLPLVAAYHAFEGVDTSREMRETAITHLLAEPSLGKIWLIGAHGRLLGYIAICFGFSIELGGREAFIDEFYIAEPDRGKGIGRAAVQKVIASLSAHGIVALHLEVDTDNKPAQQLYAQLGFKPRGKYRVLSLTLPGTGHS